jgi:hypothetical protein
MNYALHFLQGSVNLNQDNNEQNTASDLSFMIQTKLIIPRTDERHSGMKIVLQQKPPGCYPGGIGSR